MLSKISHKLYFYKKDLKEKGLYWSLIHRLYKLPYGRAILTPIVNFLKPDSIQLHGFTFFIDKKDIVLSQELLISGKWEEFETEVFKRNIKNGDIVLDIGAHIGYYTLLASKLVGKKGRVYAFEPDPRNFKLLSKNIQENSCENVVLINQALGDRVGSLKLYLHTQNTGDHRIFKSGGKRNSIDVRVTTLDAYFKDKHQKIDFIKMDVQGSEYKVLKGAKKMLKENSLTLVAEFFPQALQESGTSPKKLLTFLRENKFSISEIDERNMKLVKIVDDSLLLKEYTKSYENIDNFTNLLCKKS